MYSKHFTWSNVCVNAEMVNAGGLKKEAKEAMEMQTGLPSDEGVKVCINTPIAQTTCIHDTHTCISVTILVHCRNVLTVLQFQLISQMKEVKGLLHFIIMAYIYTYTMHATNV